MSMETALSVGIGILKHRQEIGAALSSLGKLSGEGFSKIAQELHLPQGLSQKISNALNENKNPQNTSSVQVLAGLRYFDADKNGQITQDELTQGLDKLKSGGQNTTENGAKLYSMGDMLLKNYTKVAQLDGNTGGISTQDAVKLVSQDCKGGTLSSNDWKRLDA
jgi:hypothetical protein